MKDIYFFVSKSLYVFTNRPPKSIFGAKIDNSKLCQYFENAYVAYLNRNIIFTIVLKIWNFMLLISFFIQIL